MGQLDGKTAFITGSTRGIGLAIAKAFLKEGARVIISSRKSDSVQKVVEALQSTHGEKVMGVSCHVGKVDTHAAVFESIHSQFGAVDILINNAAANPFFGPMMNIEWAAFDKTFEVNIRGVLSLSRQFARQLPADIKGSIVNVSSIFGLGAAPHGRGALGARRGPAALLRGGRRGVPAHPQALLLARPRQGAGEAAARRDRARPGRGGRRFWRDGRGPHRRA